MCRWPADWAVRRKPQDKEAEPIGSILELERFRTVFPYPLLRQIITLI